MDPERLHSLTRDCRPNQLTDILFGPMVAPAGQPADKGRRKASPPVMPRKSKGPPSASPPTEGRWWIWLVAVLALTFVAYLPSLDNDFTNWDDTVYVTENLLLARPSFHAILTTPVNGNYHPVTMWSLALNYQLSQLHPASYHWLSLLLHLANTALTFLFIRKLTGGALWAALVTSLFFGIHPMHVESVAWIAERKDALFAFFYLLGLLTYLRYLDTKRRAWLLATLAAFILSVGSKPAAVVFPATLLAIDWYRRRPFSLGVVLEKVPFVAISIAIGLLTIHAQESAGALTGAAYWTPFKRVLLASYGTVMYVVKLIAPFGLSAIYPYPRRNMVQLGGEFYLAFAILIVLLLAAVFIARRNRPVLFGLLFFVINIALVTQLFTFGHALMADRYTYLPYIGLLFALSAWMDGERDPLATGSLAKTFAAGLLLLLVPVCLFQTWKRCDVWQNSETLWRDTIQKYPHRVFDAYFLRGIYYHRTLGQPAAAMMDYDEALAINPQAPHVWANKGALMAELGRADSAYLCVDRAIALKPDLADALNDRGVIKARRGDLAGAIADFTRSIAAAPQYRDPCENRAVAYYMLHEYESAIADSRRAIAIDPGNPENHALHDAIGQSLQALDRYGEAVAEHDAAIRGVPYTDPRIAGYYLNRSLAYAGLGDLGRAQNDAREAQRRGATVRPAYLRQLGLPEGAAP